MNDIIEKYNPYDNIELSGSNYEDKFLMYFNDFKKNVTVELNKDFINRIIDTNNQAVNRIIESYKLDTNFYHSTKELKRKIRIIKDIILISEPASCTKEHIKNIDKMVDKAIEGKNMLIGLNEIDKEKVQSLLNNYQPNQDNYLQSVLSFKNEISKMIDYYHQFYSSSSSIKKSKKLIKISDELIDQKARELKISNIDNQLLQSLINKYQNQLIDSESTYNQIVIEIRKEYDELKKEIFSKYSLKTANQLVNKFDGIFNKFINVLAFSIDGMLESEEKRLQSIYLEHENNVKNIDLELSKVPYYLSMTEEEKFNLKRRTYENRVREFKVNIREFNKMIRLRYSDKYASKYINKVNRMADKFTNNLARMINMPVPKNSWLVRKYLWVDVDNFVNQKGIKFRKIINKPLKTLVKLAMKNELIIEEEQQLDKTKQYIFISTHYFTEDVIGLFVSLDRQAHMLMGTTDQIENNPLMLAAALFGFFHVDRMDSGDRKECFLKQNALIDHGTSFINYVSGSWENSENELQPLSFSGPYRTSVQKDVLIVPVASYLVEEEKKIYMRFGEPLDLRQYREEEANEIIRDTLASMHYKQMEKYSHPIKDIKIKDGDREIQTHDLPYEQHINYMNERGFEYWNQPWTKPFAEEEIGIREKKVTNIKDVYQFIDSLSRDKLIELSSMLADTMVKIDESERYNIVEYLDSHYADFKEASKTRKKMKRK